MCEHSKRKIHFKGSDFTRWWLFILLLLRTQFLCNFSFHICFNLNNRSDKRRADNVFENYFHSMLMKDFVWFHEKVRSHFMGSSLVASIKSFNIFSFSFSLKKIEFSPTHLDFRALRHSKTRLDANLHNFRCWQHFNIRFR